MNEQMEKMREEIEQTLNEQKEMEKHFSQSMERDDNLIGWIEALEYVLGLMGDEEE
jgi:uncharacterized membrane-anchored protein YhcB (DUF1043 family)